MLGNCAVILSFLFLKEENGSHGDYHYVPTKKVGTS